MIWNNRIFTFGSANKVQKIHAGQTITEPVSEYTQYPIIRNGHIRHGAEISGNFKKPLFKVSNLRNALK